jgi:hypothetical protein
MRRREIWKRLHDDSEDRNVSIFTVDEQAKQAGEK